MADGGTPHVSRGKRLLWFAALWIAGVLAVVSVAYGIRLIIGA